ncbi:TVP38/TMEM64 family protein [Bacillus salipaludis]|uniref:TVP38/TMEM64 family membrane protein n=1 Tax=Bacillus salipaludis TaxID=2547811 RepID=A0A4R5VUR3_9BACI|nr:VTT domain-containing protein [Bacillus salipaludis]MDQ6597681.1 VTT domain-containing protein [Bacillus salipaludis]TDK62919.1 TVP38/TMEM64 family protein [Bacillus salipaludis]
MENSMFLSLKLKKPTARTLSIGSLMIFLLLTGIYLYFVHTGAAKGWLESIRQLGVFGIVFGIMIQSVVNVIPAPGEFVSLFLIEIYGPVAGGFYSFIGGVIGAVLAYHLSDWIARPIIEPMAKPYLEKIDRWLKKQGDIGLLIIRFVPLVPYHFINYAAGILRVNKMAFIWTTALGILPYTITISSIFAGFRYGKFLPFIIGGGLFILSSILSIVFRRKMD